ncbi:sialate O-acetylesterase [Flaviaesturariibacter amylovorans]|uniref:Sialate O-acetylesterase n=1 Tax=Flaviaesturariibacter amylovorans TaxID=1084520 RepID=A0ABP8H6W7_9BACT
MTRPALKKHVFLASLLVLATHLAFSQTQLPSIFSDNMVLQQQSQVTIWGTDKPNTRVVVKGSWGKEAKTTSDAAGQWRLKLPTPAAGGGPQTLSVTGSTPLTVKNVLLGEVWLCSGQSNMGMTLNGYYNQPVIGSNETILNSKNEQIRMYTQARATSLTPTTEMKGDWQLASPATTGKFSAVAYYFARTVHAQLGVPIGIIHTSWGGSPIEAWMDKESLSGFTIKPIPDTIPKANPHRIPTLLYNAMIHPYAGYTIKGALWYQGEANRENHYEYEAMFSRMVGLWRKQWQQGDFPVYYAQIAPFGYPGTTTAPYLREAQLKCMQSVPRTGMAVTLDLGEEKSIHPAPKEQVGQRLAYWALTKDYNMTGIAFSGPVYKSMEKTANGRMIVRFENASLGLHNYGKPLAEFEIAGEDKVFYPATATINPEVKGQLPGVTVWSDSVKAPVAVRYAFRSWTTASLFDTHGLPASSFRTDDWPHVPPAKQ